MITTTELSPGITLRACQDSRFKQGCISLQLIRQMDARESAMNALLPSVLLRGTNRHQSLRAITEHLDELYGAAVGPLVRRVGDYQTTGLYCSFMDDRFALPGDQVLMPMIAFLEELLLDSPLEDGAFLHSFVDSEKKNLISAIESELNDKRTYAMGQLLRAMCSQDTFGLPRLGEPEDVAAIDAKTLYKHYHTILKTSPIHIFYVGSAPQEQVTALLMPLIEKRNRAPQALAPQTGFHPCEGKTVEQTMDVAQGKLCMGFLTPITNRDSGFPAMQVFNAVFGAGMTSKLFVNIREKQSLCYAIGSGYYGTKGIVTVSAGIDFDKEQLVKEEVLRQLDACREGNITDAELTAAREAVMSSLRATHDSPGSIESYYATAALSGLTLTPKTYMEALERVTREDVIAAARQLTLHTTYFLKGENL